MIETNPDRQRAERDRSLPPAFRPVAIRFLSREWRALISIFGEHRRRYMWGCLFLALSDMFQLAVPACIGWTIDALAAGKLDAAGLQGVVAAVVLSAFLVTVVRYAWRHFVFGTARYIERDVIQRLYQHLQGLDAAFFTRHKVGDLMAHATNDVQAIRMLAGEGVMASWDAISMATVTLIFMLITVDARLVAAAMVPLVIMVPTTFWLGERTHERFKVVQAAFSDLSDRVQENIAGMRVVKSFAREQDQIARFDALNTAYQQAFVRLARIDVIWDPLAHGLGGLSLAIGLGYGGYLLLRGDVTLGGYVAFNSYVGLMMWPMMASSWTMNMAQRAVASMGRLLVLFDAEPAIADRPDAMPLPDPQGLVSVRNLSFAYGADWPLALDDVSLDLAPGKTVGILGATGAGKSTLVSLLLRLADPPPGTVFLDGHDVLDLKLTDLRRAIAAVPQDTFLFSRTIAENVGFDPVLAPPTDLAAALAVRQPGWLSPPVVTRPMQSETAISPAVLRAVALAQLESDLAKMPKGLNTEVGERGVTLSGGQRQRVGIARALAKTAPVLVLDDCMSAVDADTEARLLAALGPERKTRATLLISNRTAALAACDEIVVLVAGQVVQRGTHTHLIAANGYYADVYHRQQLEAALEQHA